MIDIRVYIIYNDIIDLQEDTFMKAKLENFWYHYKGITIAAVFIAIVLIIGFKSCADKTLPDLKIL